MLKKALSSCFILFSALALNACESSLMLNIGPSSNTQTIKENKITEGLTYFKIKIDAKKGAYTLSSKLLSNSEADKLVAQLDTLKVNAINKLTISPKNNLLTRVTAPGTDPNGFSLGELVQYGKFESIERARKAQKWLAKSNVKLSVSHTSFMAKQEGPFEVNILKLNSQRFKGQFISALGHQRAFNAEQTSVIAENNNALAAVNAGFFVHRDNFGVLGDPAGISVIDGHLVSEAVAKRPALLIKNTPKLSVDILDNVTTQLTIKFADKHYLLNGINRDIGKILNCGQQVKEQSTQAAHDYLCESSNEIIIYNYFAGDLSALTKEDEFSFFIDDKNNIYDIEEPLGTTVPKNHYLIRAIGDKALLLKALVKENTQAKVQFKVQSSTGTLNLEKGMYLVNGGPTLLINGKEDISVRSEQGWDTKEYLFGKNADDDNDKIDKNSADIKSRKQHYYNWVVSRNPRTAVGITKTGDLYLVVIYGRNPGVSAGASLTEMSNIMKDLHVDKAMNLDGGGSSVMVIDGVLTGRPSDARGERAVGDALLFLPAQP